MVRDSRLLRRDAPSLLQVRDALVGSVKDRPIVIKIDETAHIEREIGRRQVDRARQRADRVAPEQRLADRARHRNLVHVCEGQIDERVGARTRTLRETLEERDGPVGTPARQ